MHLHFIVDQKLACFAERHTADDIDRHHYLFTNSSWAWIVQTALLLREAGFSVSLGDEYDLASINFGLANTIRAIQPNPNIFVVSIDADQLRPRWANISIVQNKYQTGRSAYWLPHWPQPGLIPRSPERKNFTHVGFFGLKRYLYKDESWWHNTCEKNRFKFSVRSPQQWHDYNDIDIAIGIRSLNNKRYYEKPPTKLFNAWLAGVVFIGGNDSAYYQVGHPETDYLLARDEKILLYYLNKLQNDSAFANLLINEGQKMSNNLGSRSSTLERWIELLEKQITPKYKQWFYQKPFRRNFSSLIGIHADSVIRYRNQIWRQLKALKPK